MKHFRDNICRVPDPSPAENSSLFHYSGELVQGHAWSQFEMLYLSRSFVGKGPSALFAYNHLASEDVPVFYFYAGC